MKHGSRGALLVLALTGLVLGAAWIVLDAARTPALPEPLVRGAPAPAAGASAARLEAEEGALPAGEALSTRAEPGAAPGATQTRTPLAPKRASPVERAAARDGDRLLFTVLDARLRAVTRLERVDLEYALGAAPPGMESVLESADGTFECAIQPFRGTIRVHSTSFGDAVAAFPAPVDGASHAELVLSCHATITGRVVHDAEPVAGATVCLQSLNAAAGAWEARLGCGRPPERCRWVRGGVQTDRDGTFVFALEGPGEYVLVARHEPEGAVTSAPVVVADARAAAPIVLELAPASRAEIRWTDAPELERLRVLTLAGENGLLLNAPVEAQGAVGTFDCLPAGSYVLPRPLAGFGEAPLHLEVDGNGQTLVKRELSKVPVVELVLACDTEGARVEARLYRLGCHADLVGETRLGPGPQRLAAGDPGAHLLVLEQRGTAGRIAFRRLLRLSLAAGRNELASRPIELPGEIVCVSERASVGKRDVHARFELEDGSVLYVPLDEAVRSPGEKQAQKQFFALSGRTPVGTCELVRLARDGLEVLQRDVHVGAGAPARVTLSAGSAERR